MSIILSKNQYGKGGVRLVKVERHSETHDVTEIEVEIKFHGAFEQAYTDGDNSRIVPTDTMKNTVYALAKDHSLGPIESFGMMLSQHFLESHQQIARVEVALEESLWQHIEVGQADGEERKPHPYAFLSAGNEKRTCLVRQTRGSLSIESGIRDLHILKTTQSGFEGFPRDAFTTLKETSDRLFGTNLQATWCYREPEADVTRCRGIIRQTLLDSFARHDSLSVQHTLYAMGEAALEQCKEITSIYLSMPNVHRLLVDLSPFDRENANEIFIPVDEPYGLIEATLERA